ncbi:MAG: ABC transporter substrate-binding protein [Deltaproteobacteria bacterium]|nr:ABC transporter substrate-binding protein [Deltaproteobacteria bacterium]
MTVQVSHIFRLSALAASFFIGFNLLSPPVLLARPLRIGEINPLTGKLAKHGQEIHEGILFAVEEVNKRGGILGREVQLVSRDDQSLPEVAINQTEDLVYGVGVAGLTGGYVDSLVGPISEIAARHRVPYVASASLQRNLTIGRRNPYFFRVSRLDGIVEPLCGFLTSQLRPKNAAVLFSATPGSSEFASEMRTCLKQAGVPVSTFDKFRPGTSDFSSFLMKLRMERADVLISGGFFPDHLLLARQMKDQKLSLRAYLGPWGVAYPSFIEEMGSASHGLFGMCAWNPGITLPGTEQASEAFVNGFRTRFAKQPNTTTMHGYSSARALLAAMEKAMGKHGGVNGDALCRELRSLDLLLPMERLVFDDNGDPRYYRQVVVQIQEGRMVTVYPPDRATGSIVTESP